MDQNYIIIHQEYKCSIKASKCQVEFWINISSIPTPGNVRWNVNILLPNWLFLEFHISTNCHRPLLTIVERLKDQHNSHLYHKLIFTQVIYRESYILTVSFVTAQKIQLQAKHKSNKPRIITRDLPRSRCTISTRGRTQVLKIEQLTHRWSGITVSQVIIIRLQIWDFFTGES